MPNNTIIKRNSFKRKSIEHKQFKVIVVGCAGVGKTCTIARYVYKSFDTRYKATIGFDLAIKQVNEKTSLQLWDLSGQERFFGMSNMFCRGAAGIVIVYDITEPDYLDQVEKWAAVLDKYAVTSSTNKIPIIAFGNKMDLLDVESHTHFLEQQQQQQGHEMKQRAELEKKYSISKWFEGSAKFGSGIDEAFGYLTEEIISYQRKQAPSEPVLPAPAARTVIKLCDDEEDVDLEEDANTPHTATRAVRASRGGAVACSSCSNGHARTEAKPCKASQPPSNSSRTMMIRV